MARPKTGKVGQPVNEIAPPPPEEKKRLTAEKKAKDAVAEQTLLKAGGDLGLARVEAADRLRRAGELREQTADDMAKAAETVSSITQSHIQMRAEYENRIARLRDRIAALEEQVAAAKGELAMLKGEKRSVLAEKDAVIESQKHEMKELAYQFSDMLMKALITITEDFETQASELGRDEAGLPHRERLKEFNLDRVRV